MLLPPPPAVTAPATPSRYGFRKAELGMDLATWRASAPQRASAACGAAAGGATVCRTADQPLGGAYRARDLAYTFVDGRLAAISFATSMDGFAYATAEIEGRFGAPSDVKRGQIRLANGLQLPHVLMTWRNGRSTIRLNDPSTSGGRLSVRFTSDALASRLPPQADAPSRTT